MLLRIEDTDRERSTEAAIDAIIDGLSWLGLDWDGDVVYQFARAPRATARSPRSCSPRAHAYRCYASPQELDEMREKAKAARAAAALRRALARSRRRARRPPASRRRSGSRRRATGETVVDDQVQGRVAWPNKDLDDFVLLRSDGTPTYMLAVVVDDHDMGVTQIIRGDDHLTNAARQKQIYQAHGLERSGFRAYSADPWSRRRETLEAAWRARRRRLSRHGLSAAALAQLSRAARLEPGRQGVLHRREEMIEAFDLAQVGIARRRASISPSWRT